MGIPVTDAAQSWPPPNYVNPVSLSVPVHVVNALCISSMTLFLTFRFWSRVGIVKKNPCADDWVMLCAYILCLVMEITHMVQLKYGIGRHLYDVKPTMTVPALKTILITQTLFGPAVALTKISVCLGYHRLFPTSCTNRFIYILITIIVGYGLTTGIGSALQCTPISAMWTSPVPGQKSRCINATIFFVWQVATNAALDLVVFLWPIRYLWRLKMPRNTRVALTACFCCGIIICVFALVRVWLIVEYFQAWDITWKGAIINLIVSIELSLGVICGSLPGIRPLILEVWRNNPENIVVRSFRKNVNNADSDKTLQAESNISGMNFQVEAEVCLETRKQEGKVGDVEEGTTLAITEIKSQPASEEHVDESLGGRAS